MTGPAVSAAPDASLHTEVTWFYARQMHWIDNGDTGRWASTFTADAVFHLPARPRPMRGRAELVAGARAAAAASTAAGERRRHVVRLLGIARHPAGTVRVSSSVVVHADRDDGTSRVEQVCLCEDTLVRSDGQLRTSLRRIRLAGTD